MLLKRRGTLAQTRVQLRQSLHGVGISTVALFTQINALLKRIDGRIKQLIDQLGWHADYQHCLTLPGIGPLNAAALVAAFHRGAFAGANAFVSFIGFDVRIRESGRFKGKRKLTKRGEAELRRLLYCAANPAPRSEGRSPSHKGGLAQFQNFCGRGFSLDLPSDLGAIRGS